MFEGALIHLLSGFTPATRCELSSPILEFQGSLSVGPVVTLNVLILVVAMSGATSFPAHQTERSVYGTHSTVARSYVESVRTGLIQLVNTLHSMGFVWQQNVTLILKLDFGNGHTMCSTTTIQPLSPPVLSVVNPFELSLSFPGPMTNYVEFVKDGFMATLDTLRGRGYLPRTSEATMTMDLTLSSMRSFYVSMSSEDATDSDTSMVPDSDSGNDDDSHPFHGGHNDGEGQRSALPKKRKTKTEHDIHYSGSSH